MSKKRNNVGGATSKTRTPQEIEKRRRRMEGVATLGLLFVAAAMLGPFMNQAGVASGWFEAFKWIYAAGALIYTFARLVSVNDPADSLRLRRLRRLEFWAGMAFCVGAFFWFYNEKKYEDFAYVGILAILKDTVMFSLAGAAIQVIASWMISFRQAKERKARENGEAGKGKKSGDEK
ncbi:MAG: hypothetical protein K2L83_04295 [Muribaculaceae bacterium]|nr:hypothetical protein [Muribaculaceae bacterium]MDE6329917.1 hypothetical protein [Muribaculaceae bacterium]